MSQEFEKQLDREIDAAEPKAMPFTTFAGLGALKPEEEDENVLFKGNWLGRGGGLLLTASSGTGKSSLVTQALWSWTLGKEFLAKPNLPALKCSLVQSEDSVRDLQEIRDGMVAGFKANGWTDEELAKALDGVHLWNCVGKVGREFCTWLLNQQKRDPVDIIAINPIQGFFGGDVSRQEDVSRFLREGIDPILKGEFGTKPCAAVLVQHTTKITSGQAEGRVNVNDYGEYIGAGSHEWTDWCRAKIVFLKRKMSEDYFDLKAAKRGKRLKWKGKDGLPTTNRTIAHSSGYIFWRVVDDPAEIEQLEAEEGGDGKRPKPVTRLHLKRERDKGPGENAKAVLEYVNANLTLGTELTNDILREWAEKNWVRDVARLAVSRFEETREQEGVWKDKDGHYTRTEPKDDCQNED